MTMDKVIVALIGALTGGAFTAIGWFVLHRLTVVREEHSRRQQATIQYLQRQIEELYGPLLGMLQESRYLYEVALKTLPSHDGRIDTSRFSETDSEMWNYLIENHFLPNNAKIAELIRTHLHLLELGKLPPSYDHFARHQAQFDCLHKLWRQKSIDNRSIAGIGWPKHLEVEVEGVLAKLRQEYSEYLGDSTLLPFTKSER